MSSEPVRDSYRQDLPEHPLRTTDVDRLRFAVTVRGYAMDQVDYVLARLSREIADRDALIAELTGTHPPGRHRAPVEVAHGDTATVDPTDGDAVQGGEQR